MDRSCCHTVPRARTDRAVQTELCFAPKPSIGIGTRRRQTILASQAPELGVDGAWGVGLLRGHSRTLAHATIITRLCVFRVSYGPCFAFAARSAACSSAIC